MAEEKKAEKKKEFKPYKKLRYCPKCGPGVRLAEHQDRLSCGKCGYFEIRKKV
jgi:small subunit ribosomal protein S27Ae